MCDKCKKKILPKEDTYLSIVVKETSENWQLGFGNDYDLCEECLNEFYIFLKGDDKNEKE